MGENGLKFNGSIASASLQISFTFPILVAKAIIYPNKGKGGY